MSAMASTKAGTAFETDHNHDFVDDLDDDFIHEAEDKCWVTNSNC